MKPRGRRGHHPLASRVACRPRIRHKLLLRSALKTAMLIWRQEWDKLPELGELVEAGTAAEALVGLGQALLRSARIRGYEHERTQRLAVAYLRRWHPHPHARATRSDLLANIALVVYCLLSRTDLKSLRVGWRRKYTVRGQIHDFAGLPRKVIARWSELHESTIWRVFWLLRHAGYVHGPAWSTSRGGDGVNVIKQPVEERDEGGWKGLPAIRRFTELFFERIGEGPSLHEMRTTKKPTSSPAPATPVSVRGLVHGLAEEHALERPPDSG